MPSDAGRRIVSPAVATEVRGMLEGVLSPGGTASEVSVPGYTLAGKTGTAQIATDQGARIVDVKHFTQKRGGGGFAVGAGDADHRAGGDAENHSEFG